jgi:hypothetical protein
MLYSDAFSFEGAHRRQIRQGIKQSNHGGRVVTAGVRSGLCPLKAQRRTAFSGAHFKISAPTFVTTASNIAKRSLVVVGGTGLTCFFSLPAGRDLFYLVFPTNISPLSS